MTRVRVTAPATAARPALESRETPPDSDVGQVFVRSLIRSQLRLALVVAGVPGLAETRLAGVPFGWVLLGAGIYPVIGLSAWLYNRTAARNEARYRDLAGDQ